MPANSGTAARGRFAILAWQIATVAILFVLWEWVSVNRYIDPLFIGQPTKIVAYFWEGVFVTGTLVYHAMWTLGGTLLSFAIGSVAGILFGLVFVLYPRVEEFFTPFLSGLNALPRIALAPLFLLWFGLGIWSKVALGASLTFFIVLANTIAGARSVDPDWIVLSRMLSASKTVIFFKVTLISAVPTMFSGLKLGLIYALLGVIAGEIIAAQYGLGQLLTYLAGTFNTNGVFAVLLLLSLIGVALMRLMDIMENYLLRWR